MIKAYFPSRSWDKFERVITSMGFFAKPIQNDCSYRIQKWFNWFWSHCPRQCGVLCYFVGVSKSPDLTKALALHWGLQLLLQRYVEVVGVQSEPPLVVYCFKEKEGRPNLVINLDECPLTCKTGNFYHSTYLVGERIIQLIFWLLSRSFPHCIF